MRTWILVAGLVSPLVACGPSIGGGEREVSVPSRAHRPSRTEVVPLEREPPLVDEPSYETRLEHENVGNALAVHELGPAERHLHLVLDGGRCYRIIAVAEQSVSLELRDENAHTLASERGRVVRISGICPRWTGSFDLRADLTGDRGRVWLFPDEGL